MSYSVAQLKNDIIASFHGTTSSKIVDFDGAINRAARQVLLDCDPQETIRTIPISSQLFNQVWDYPCPTDLKGNAIIGIRPQVNRTSASAVQQTYNQAFDLTKDYSFLNQTTIQWDTAVKSLRLSLPFLTPSQTIVNAADSLTSNGTWAATSTASNLAVDTVNYVSNSSSLSFDLAITGPTGYLENSTMSELDLSAWVSQGYFFAYVYLPTASAFTSVILRVGSSSTAYYLMTATTTQQGTTFQDGWNLLSFAWSAATTTGTPDSEALDYVRVTWTYSGAAQVGVRLDQITATLGSIYDIQYYSKYLFRTSAGAFAETETADTDLVNLDTETYNLLLWKVSEFVAQQVQGLDAQYNDGPYFAKLYVETLARYQALYKSQKILPRSTYYGFRKPSTGIGRRGY